MGRLADDSAAALVNLVGTVDLQQLAQHLV